MLKTILLQKRGISIIAAGMAGPRAQLLGLFQEKAFCVGKLCLRHRGWGSTDQNPFFEVVVQVSDIAGEGAMSKAKRLSLPSLAVMTPQRRVPWCSWPCPVGRDEGIVLRSAVRRDDVFLVPLWLCPFVPAVFRFGFTFNWAASYH